MAGPSPKVVYSSFDGDWLVDQVLSRYDIGAKRCRLLSSCVNDIYVVDGRERYVLRVSRQGWRTIDDIAWEIDLLDHIATSEVHASLPVRDTAGEALIRLNAPEGERLAVLFTFAPGSSRRGEDDYPKAYGTAVARLHNAIDGFHSSHDRFELDLTHLVDQPLELVLPFIAERTEDAPYVADLANRVRTELAQIVEGLEWAPCHGDLTGGNAYRDADDTFTFFDFDGGGFGWRAYELSVFRWSTRAYETQRSDEKWMAFLEGYRDEREIAEADLVASPLFVFARQLWFMGMHARLAPQMGTDTFAYPDPESHLKELHNWDVHLAPWSRP